MKRVTFFLTFLAAAGTLAAQPVTETCEDGRVMAVTPFNPTPCESHRRATTGATVDEQLSTAALTAPSEFIQVFGPPPTATGWSMDDRVARIKYEQDLRYFGGLVPEPVGFSNVKDFYSGWGMGRPMFYKGRYGEYCRWPDAPFAPAQANLFAAVNGAGVVVATWQVRVILKGHVLTDVHPFVPPELVSLNAERLAKLQQAANQQ